jgi:Flp pilus assembly protein TadB
MKQAAPSSWPRRVLVVVAVALLLIGGARVVYQLLAPLIPWLILIGLLDVVYIVKSRRRRKNGRRTP